MIKKEPGGLLFRAGGVSPASLDTSGRRPCHPGGGGGKHWMRRWMRRS